MAFKDGFKDKCNIYKLQRKKSNRTDLTQLKVEDSSTLESIPCRIIDNGDEEAGRAKVIFGPEVEQLEDGWRIEDIATNIKYEVVSRKKVHGMSTLHHSTYMIKRLGVQ